MKPTWRYCFCLFHSHDPKPKRNHQIASSRAKTRSRQSQTCVKYRGNIICIRWSTDVNTNDLKILNIGILRGLPKNTAKIAHKKFILQQKFVCSEQTIYGCAEYFTAMMLLKLVTFKRSGKSKYQIYLWNYLQCYRGFTIPWRLLDWLPNMGAGTHDPASWRSTQQSLFGGCLQDCSGLDPEISSVTPPSSTSPPCLVYKGPSMLDIVLNGLDSS